MSQNEFGVPSYTCITCKNLKINNSNSVKMIQRGSTEIHSLINTRARLSLTRC